jgi:hypothetical protein
MCDPGFGAVSRETHPKSGGHAFRSDKLCLHGRQKRPADYDIRIFRQDTRATSASQKHKKSRCEPLWIQGEKESCERTEL